MIKMTGKPKRKRLDRVLVEKGLIQSRNRAQALILAGDVLVDGIKASGPAQQIRPDQKITLKQPDIPFVSRGGVKLEGALDRFSIDLTDKIALDIGTSTGGFTDCMLKRGARKVYAVDVGYGQLAWSLRQDERVVVLERTNARYLTKEQVPEPVSFLTADVSFISLTKILPAFVELLDEAADCVLLVKPQFEVGPDKVGKGGVVRDDELRKEAADAVSACAQELGLKECDRVDSSLPGPKGNREILLWLKESPESPGR